VSSTVVSIDGTLVEPGEAVISVFDRGLLFGDGCFEILRTWGGVAVELDAHLDRMFETVRYLKLRTVTRDEIAASVHGAVRAAGKGEHRIRIVLTRGPGGLVTPMAELGPGRAIVIVDPFPEQPTEMSLAVVDWPLPQRSGRGHKTIAYLEHLLAQDLARAADADEAVRLDGEGAVIEGSTSNVFIVDAGAVITPAVDTGALPGIVRERVLELCAEDGIPTRVREVSLGELRSADEIFITSSLRGVMAVTRLDGVPQRPGPITAQIASAYVTRMSKGAPA
jgi:branched-chain amino acid aminotransferase